MSARRVLSATARMEAARKHRASALLERNRLIAVLSTVYESHLTPTARHQVNWHWVVCVHSPAGQLAWHITDEEADSDFSHLQRDKRHHWDGHQMLEKLDRLAMIVENASR